MFLWAVTQIYNGKKGSRPGFLRLYTPRSALFNFQASRRLRCTVFKVCKGGRCLIFKVRFFSLFIFQDLLFFVVRFSRFTSIRCSFFKVYFISLFDFQGSLLFVVHFSRFTSIRCLIFKVYFYSLFIFQGSLYFVVRFSRLASIRCSFFKVHFLFRILSFKKPKDGQWQAVRPSVCGV